MRFRGGSAVGKAVKTAKISNAAYEANLRLQSGGQLQEWSRPQARDVVASRAVRAERAARQAEPAYIVPGCTDRAMPPQERERGQWSTSATSTPAREARVLFDRSGNTATVSNEYGVLHPGGRPVLVQTRLRQSDRRRVVGKYGSRIRAEQLKRSIPAQRPGRQWKPPLDLEAINRGRTYREKGIMMAHTDTEFSDGTWRVRPEEACRVNMMAHLLSRSYQKGKNQGELPNTTGSH